MSIHQITRFIYIIKTEKNNIYMISYKYYFSSKQITMAIIPRQKLPISFKRRESGVSVNALSQRLYMMLFGIFIANNGCFRFSREVEMIIRTLSTVVPNTQQLVTNIKAQIVSIYNNYWDKLNDPEIFRVAGFFNSSFSTMYDILSYAHDIPNTLQDQLPNESRLVIPFRLNQIQFDAGKLNDFGEGTPEVVFRYNKGFDYFEKSLIFTYQDTQHIRFGEINRFITKIMVTHPDFRKGFMIALQLYLEYSIMFRSPFQFYRYLETEYGHVPYFENTHSHYFKDHTQCSCNQKNREGEYDELTEDNAIEHFALGDILWMISGIIYENSEVDEPNDPDSDFTADYIGFWTPSIEEINHL
jgi:hypothetical protein